MKTWLLTWNPLRFRWDEKNDSYKDIANHIRQVGKSFSTWSCGVNKSIKEGDRFFLIRLGKEPRGIIASGYAASDVFTAPHWDEIRAKQDDKSRMIFVEFDKIVQFHNTPLPMSVLLKISSSYKWSTQASGISIPNDIAEELERIWE